MKRSTALLALPAALLFGALSAGALCEENPEQVCEPGRVDDCPCAGGADGVQACDDDGAAWGDCECGDDDPDAGPGDEPDAGPEGCDGDTAGDPYSPECEACLTCGVASVCADEVAACGNSADCVAFTNCGALCTDDPCIEQCAADYPAGEQPALAVVDCKYCDACPVTCAVPGFCS